MPTGNLPGWRLTYTQDFAGNSLPANWGTYTGQPGGDPYGYWSPSAVSVSNGELHLLAVPMNGSYATGGVSFYGNPQTYGMYLVRMKGDVEPNLNISNIALLWPDASNTWPPEIDFFEDSGGYRTSFTASLHAGPNGNDCCIIRNNVNVQASQWHTYGVEWTPSSLTYTIDGQAWATVYSSSLSSPAQWPSQNMDLDIQAENLGSAQPSGPIETLTVAWVAEYALGS